MESILANKTRFASSYRLHVEIATRAGDFLDTLCTYFGSAPDGFIHVGRPFTCEVANHDHCRPQHPMSSQPSIHFDSRCVSGYSGPRISVTTQNWCSVNHVSIWADRLAEPSELITVPSLRFHSGRHGIFRLSSCSASRRPAFLAAGSLWAVRPSPRPRFQREMPRGFFDASRSGINEPRFLEIQKFDVRTIEHSKLRSACCQATHTFKVKCTQKADVRRIIISIDGKSRVWLAERSLITLALITTIGLSNNRGILRICASGRALVVSER
jgi:hypothetical protein